MSLKNRTKTDKPNNRETIKVYSSMNTAPFLQENESDLEKEFEYMMQQIENHPELTCFHHQLDRSFINSYLFT